MRLQSSIVRSIHHLNVLLHLTHQFIGLLVFIHVYGVCRALIFRRCTHNKLIIRVKCDVSFDSFNIHAKPRRIEYVQAIKSFTTIVNLTVN